MELNIGIDVGGSHIDICKVSNKKLVLLDSFDINYYYKIEDLVIKIKDNLIKLDLNKYKIINMGIALPGIVDTKRNYCIKCPNLKFFKNIYLNKIFFRELNSLLKDKQLNLYVLNDANAGAIGVYKKFYKKLNLLNKDIVYLVIGTGIGSGAIINNKLILGADYCAFELGHTKVSYYKNKLIKCGCGSFNCIEALASAKALTNLFNTKYHKNYKGLKDIIQNENYEKYRFLFDEFALHLALLINNVILTINPYYIFIGGKITLSLNVFKQKLFYFLKKSIKMIKIDKDYFDKRIIFLKPNNNINEYNVVGSVFAKDFI
ncbi:MAG: ROK family protein [bacterium]